MEQGELDTNNFFEQSQKEAIKEEREFRNLIPVSGFIGEYMQYTDRQEAPSSFHFWVAIAILSATIQRRAWISKGVYNVFPNMYVILVSQTGVCRKSRAMRLGTDLIEEFDWMNVIADKTTPEALLQALQDGTKTMAKQDEDGTITFSPKPLTNSGFIRSSELAVFINKQSYTSGMVGILTDLYDCPKTFKYLTRNKSAIELKNVAISFLAGSTPEWLATNLPEAAFEGGFMSRIIFVVKGVRDRQVAWPEDPIRDEGDSLQRLLIRIRTKFRGKIALTHDARTWFTSWYEHQYSSGDIPEATMTGFVERKPDTILKLAMLLTASAGKNVIEISHLKQARLLLEWTQTRMFSAFQHINLTRIGSLRMKILEILDRQGEISRRDIMRKFGGRINSVADLDDVEKIMTEAEDMEVVHNAPAGGKSGRPSIVYRLTKKRRKETTK